MSRKTLRIVLWIAFTALWFVVWFGTNFLIHGTTDIWEAVFFFVILGLLDTKGVSWIVDHYMPEDDNES